MSGKMIISAGPLTESQYNNVPKDIWDAVWDVVTGVKQYCPGQINWIALQSGVEADDDYGFVIGDKFASFTLTEARNWKGDKDALYRKIATQVLGYPPDSEQDLQSRRADALKHLADIEAEIAVRQRIKQYVEQDIAKLDKQLFDQFPF